jgi:hypothetical protein
MKFHKRFSLATNRLRRGMIAGVAIRPPDYISDRFDILVIPTEVKLRPAEPDDRGYIEWLLVRNELPIADLSEK